MPANETSNWPDLAIGLYDRLTGRNAEISYEMKNLKVAVPSSTSPDAKSATWELNGTLTVRTNDR